MKKSLYFFILICISYEAHAIFERVRPAQYTSLSGRMIYVPHARVRTQQALPLTTEEENTLKRKAFEEERLAEAYDRNLRIRRWQQQRATRRNYGEYRLHHGSGVEPVIGLTPETVPY